MELRGSRRGSGGTPLERNDRRLAGLGSCDNVDCPIGERYRGSDPSSPLKDFRDPPPRADRGRQDDDLGPDRGPVVQVENVLVDHPDATGRYIGAYGPRLERAMDPKQRVLVSLPEIKRSGT